MADDPDQFALHGPTVTVRLPKPGDATALYRLGSDPEVTKWFSWGPYQETAEARAYLDRLPDQRETGRQLDLLLVHQRLGPIGITGLSDFSYRDRRACVGTWLGRDAWGSGANGESKRLMAYLAFEVLDLARLGAYVDVGNERSRRALKKAGFVEEGVLRGWQRRDGQQSDVISCSLLAGDWLSSSATGMSVTVEGAVPKAFPTLLAATKS
jgi:ribosomal-protein-alanine N-acetyltransferase